MKIHCYKVNGSIKKLTYTDFIELYNNKKTAQNDWHYCIEQLQENPQVFGTGKLFKFTKDNHNVFYFVYDITKEKLKRLTSVITNTNCRHNIARISTSYKIDKEVYNEELKCFVKEVYPASELLSGQLGDLILKYLDFGRKSKKIILDGDEIRITSNTLRLFKTKGIKCSKCGSEGKYFYKCRNSSEIDFHLRLYTDKMIQMTKDHIIPLSKGGANHLSNLQPLCLDCNLEKGNTISFKDKFKGLSKEELYLMKLSTIKTYCERNLNKKCDKTRVIKDILSIITTNDEKKLNKDKSLINKLIKLINSK